MYVTPARSLARQSPGQGFAAAAYLGLVLKERETATLVGACRLVDLSLAGRLSIDRTQRPLLALEPELGHVAQFI